MIRIRKARPADAPAIVDFQLRMALETENIRLDPATVRRGVRAVFRDPAIGEYLIAHEAGRILGSALILREWSDWRNGYVLWVHSVYVLPEARRGGVFRALYQHLKTRVARSTRLKGLRLYVEKKNTAAQSTYRAMGMSAEHYDLFEWLK